MPNSVTKSCWPAPLTPPRRTAAAKARPPSRHAESSYWIPNPFQNKSNLLRVAPKIRAAPFSNWAAEARRSSEMSREASPTAKTTPRPKWLEISSMDSKHSTPDFDYSYRFYLIHSNFDYSSIRAEFEMLSSQVSAPT